jgi:hypothetical protein
MPKKYGRVRFPIIAAMALVIVGGIAAAVAVERTHDPDYWATVAALVVPLVLNVGGKIRREAKPPSLHTLGEQAKVLRRLALAYWDGQVKLRIPSYALPVPFEAVSTVTGPVTTTTHEGDRTVEHEAVQPVTVMAPWASILKSGRAEPPKIEGTFESIADVFGAEGLPSRLVVLGEPGAGKSILAMSLTVELLQAKPKRGVRVRSTRTKAIPVLLQLAMWDPAVPLKTWAATQMARTYPWLGEEIQMEEGHSSTLATWLIEQRRVMMVLDGLDEIAKENRLTAFEKLSEAASHGQEMVVTCRTREYAQVVFEAKHPMPKTPVIRLFPLPLPEVGNYLKKADTDDQPRFSRLLRHVETAPDGALAKALRSPFALWLVTTVYRDADKNPSELSAYDSEHHILRHLLNGLIPAVYSTEVDDKLPRREKPQVAAAQRRLSKIAKYLGPESEDQNIDWWRLPEHVPGWFIGGIIGPLVGCLLGAAVGLAAAIRFNPNAGVRFGILFGVITGVLSGVTSARMQEHPRAMDLHLGFEYSRFVSCITVGVAVGLTAGWADARHGGLIVGLISGAVVGPACTIPCKRVFGWKPGITAGLAGAIAIGLASGLSKGNGQPTLSGLGAGVIFALAAWVFVGIFQPSKDKLVVNPRSLLKRDRAGSLIVAVTAGIAFAVVFGVALGSLIGVVAFVALTVTVSLTVSMWAAFNVSRIWLASTGMLPMQIMGFLDEAYRRGILRQDGGSYQFRHIELKEALREPAPEPTAVKPGPAETDAAEPDRLETATEGSAS